MQANTLRCIHIARTAHALRIAAPVSLALPLLTAAPVAAQTFALTTLATFDGTNGKNPHHASVTRDRNGNLYGTTQFGGASNKGTVFKIAAGTDTITTLATFTGAANGAYPDEGLTIDSDGNLYGITNSGGPANCGAVFEVAAGTDIVTTIAAFNVANGATPRAGLTRDSNGNLYGTTTGGGASRRGTVFEIASGTRKLTTIASFNGANGTSPRAGVTIDSNGNLYGTTSSGGANNAGTVFKLTPSGAATTPNMLNLYFIRKGFSSL